MKSLKQSLLAIAALLAIGASAQAGVNAVDVPRITNGGTGFIGVTESAGTPRVAMNTQWRDATSSVPQQAGEATTMVNGQPNAVVPTHGAAAGMQQAPAMGAAGGAPRWDASPRDDARYGRGTPD